MRYRTPDDLKGMCHACYLKENWCICDNVPSIDNQIFFLIIRHSKEAAKSSNSARLAALALENVKILDYGKPGQPFEFGAEDLDEKTWLLYPPAGELTLPPSKLLEEKPTKVVVLDGTWRQARQMFRRISALHSLPRLFLKPKKTSQVLRVRKPPHPWAMATIEAISRTIESYDSPQKAEQLDHLFTEMVVRFRKQRGWPVEGYSIEQNKLKKL